MDIDQEKRMAGDYEIIHALHIGDREIVLGENPSAPEDERYVCAFCQQHEIFANYTEVMVSDDYPELVKLFGERVAEQAEKTRIALNGPKIQGIPNSAITAEDCEQVSYQEDIRGKVVVIRPEVLRREYRHATCQLQLCTSGSGAYPNSRGTACYCTELYSGQRARFERSDILGVIAPEDLPRVFDHGYTGLNGRRDKRATGLGLYLSKRVLDQLGHTIAIASEPGRGTRVTIGLESLRMRAE